MPCMPVLLTLHSMTHHQSQTYSIIYNKNRRWHQKHSKKYSLRDENMQFLVPHKVIRVCDVFSRDILSSSVTYYRVLCCALQVMPCGGVDLNVALPRPSGAQVTQVSVPGCREKYCPLGDFPPAVHSGCHPVSSAAKTCDMHRTYLSSVTSAHFGSGKRAGIQWD